MTSTIIRGAYRSTKECDHINEHYMPSNTKCLAHKFNAYLVRVHIIYLYCVGRPYEREVYRWAVVWLVGSVIDLVLECTRFEKSRRGYTRFWSLPQAKSVQHAFRRPLFIVELRIIVIPTRKLRQCYKQRNNSYLLSCHVLRTV